jgi:hypothetical protein
MDRSKSGSSTDTDALLVGVLEHHGVKGMKWGSRKGGSSAPSHPTPAPSADHIVAEAHKAKIKSGGVKALSNHDLQQLVTRMNLEQQHHNLAGNRQTKIDSGHGHVKKILSVAKTLNDIHNTVNGPVGKAIKKAVTK